TPTMMTPPNFGGPPRLPGSPIGGPGGPGASPVVSPGPGGGAQAAPIAKIKAAPEQIPSVLHAFEIDNKESHALKDALRTLNPRFGKPQDQDLGPAARAQMAQPPPSPLAGMAPPGMAGGGGGPPPAPPPGMGPGEMGGGAPGL